MLIPKIEIIQNISGNDPNFQNNQYVHTWFCHYVFTSFLSNRRCANKNNKSNFIASSYDLACSSPRSFIQYNAV